MNTPQKLDLALIGVWLEQTLSLHGLKRPDGRMLFAYDLSESDFQNLEALIKKLCLDAGGFVHLVTRMNAFSALFVVYAAEWWKHNYEGGVWDWSPIVESLGGDELSFPQMVRSECVTRGLKFWGHKPLTHGKRFIGAIAAHGGIPMKLLAQGVGRLSLVLGQVLKQASRYNWNLAQIEEGVEQYQHQLPSAYRRPEISGLLARFIDTVLQLKSEYRLNERADPIAHLDSEAPEWRRRFPVSLELEAAQTLLVGLVREASLQKPGASADVFRCDRRLIQISADGPFSIESFLIFAARVDANRLAQHFGLRDSEQLPRYIAIDLETEIRQNFLEGRFVHGASDPIVSLSGQKASLKGSAALAEHRLCLREHSKDIGERVTVSGGGQLPLEDPWVFVPGEDGVKRFIAAGSARVQTSSAMIALPPGWQTHTSSGTPAQLMGTLELGGVQRDVVQIVEDATISFCDLRYRIRLAQNVTNVDLYQWAGSRLPEASGRPVFRDKVMPRLFRADEDGLVKVPLTEQRWTRSGSDEAVNPKEAFGPIDVSISHDGELMGRQRIFVLPPFASIQYLSGIKVGTGTVRIAKWGNIDASVRSSGSFTAQLSSGPEPDVLNIALSAENEPPAEVIACVKWHHSPTELTLRLPYPVTGGRFFHEVGGVLPDGAKTSVKELIGLRLQIFDTNPSLPKTYAIQICMGSGFKETSYRYTIATDSNGRSDVRLIDYQKTIESLLGLSDELDATVRVVLIVGNAKATEISIARYTTELQIGVDCVCLPQPFFASVGSRAMDGARILTNPVSDLVREPMELMPLNTEGVFTGTWDTRSMDSSLGTWLIYPSADSTFDFRPRTWSGGIADEESTQEQTIDPAVCSLSRVLSISDYAQRWSGLHEVVSAMSSDHGDSSWKLLNGLWERFNHLPLPALDIWKMLGKHSKGLLSFILVSPLAGHELTVAIRRFRDETGWAPELTTLEDWHEVVAASWAYWSKQMPEDLAKTVFLTQLESRLELVKNEFPGLELILDFLSFEISNVLPSSLQVLGAQTSIKVDLLVKALWTGGESLANVQLFTVNAMRDNWPGRGFFEEAFSAFLQNLDSDSKRLLAPIFPKLFWIQAGDFKLSVANMPVLCALWATTSTSRVWWAAPTNRLNLRRIRDFDPIWFEQSFRHACSVLLSIQGLMKPKHIVELPNG